MSDATLTLRVRTIRYEAEGINSYELVDPAGAELPPFTAGAHLDVHLSGNIVRQYSFCNDPAERHRYVIAVLRENPGRGGSRKLHAEVRAGDVLTVSAPRNNFPLAEDAARHLLIAGGIGVTPLIAMLARLRTLNAEFILHYCTRSPEQTAFSGEIKDLIEAGRVVIHHDYGRPADGLNVAELLRDYRPGTHLYCCGPTGLMAAVRDAASTWPGGTVHFEYFTPPASFDTALDGEFKVKIARTGELVAIPKDKTILETLRAHGMTLDSSCESGTCGTCRTRYLEGEPDHRDFVLTDDEQKDNIMICVSRAKSAVLTLDL
ncbi:MAG: PDR/VanB family oxidoreductase [Pseudomonadota bacterium]